MRKVYLALFLFVISAVAVVLYFQSERQNTPEKIIPEPTITPTPTKAEFNGTTYYQPTVKPKQVYQIAMVGDSMTVALGPHGGGFSEYINALYKKDPADQQRIVIDNYAVSSNILAVNDQLTKRKTISEYSFGPLTSVDYDVILVESYAYNPLSQYGIEEGIKKQTEALDKLMVKLTTARPHAMIVFVATIAPNSQNFAKATQTNKTDEHRIKQVEERIAYLKNHIDYARTHNIPLINIYEKSLTENGEGNTEYIDPSDDIHPSAVGVIFIGKELGDFIHGNQILPK